MTNEELTNKIGQLERELNELRNLFYKDNFSNLEVFRKKVEFRGGVEFGGGITGIDNFTELNQSQTSPTNGMVWEDWDLSAIVPVGTTAVMVYMRNDDTSAHSIGVRKNGSSAVRTVGVNANSGTVYMIAEVDANRIIERYTSDGTPSNSDFRIHGCWT